MAPSAEIVPGHLFSPAHSLRPKGQFVANSGFSPLTSTDSRIGIEFDFTAKRLPDPPPSLMLQYWTARSTAARLQDERRILQLRLRSLQQHLSLHKFHIKFADEMEAESRPRIATFQEALQLLEMRRKVLIDSHLASVHGSHAEEYRTLLAEHLQLEDRFRQISASHVVTRYSLQKLIIDIARGDGPPQTVCGLCQPGTPPIILLFRPLPPIHLNVPTFSPVIWSITRVLPTTAVLTP